MGYFYLICVAILFSFGGTFVKLINPFFSSSYITFFRFVVGVFFLLLLKLIKRQRFQTNFRAVFRMLAGWLIFGAVAKWLAYLTENYALSQGPSYGNIVVQPAQAIFITLASVFLFREKLSAKKFFCIFLCIGGVLCISWNGRPLADFFHDTAFLMILFVISGLFAGGHVLSQKMAAGKMDIIDSNLTIFSISALLAFFPVAPGIVDGELAGIRPDLPCILAILGFGFNTGIGFYLNAKAIPLVPLYMVPIIQSTMVIFSIIWGALFFQERITGYIIAGTVIFLIGLVWLQLLNAKEPPKAAEGNTAVK